MPFLSSIHFGIFEGPNNYLVDNDASEQFKQVLKDSIFSLCPSGSGPNSIRLWESIAFGSIPVILADHYLPPGKEELWRQAAVFCDENSESIITLPDRLSLIANDSELLAEKRHAMRQLWLLYGPDCFIYDIIELKLFYEGRNSLPACVGFDIKLSTLLSLNIDDELIFSSFITRILLAPYDFKKEILESEILQKKYLKNNW